MCELPNYRKNPNLRTRARALYYFYIFMVITVIIYIIKGPKANNKGALAGITEREFFGNFELPNEITVILV